MGLTDEQRKTLMKRVDSHIRLKRMLDNMHSAEKWRDLSTKRFWVAFYYGLLFPGGGFLYLRRYLMGVAFAIVFSAFAGYVLYVAILSLLSYVGDFKRDWDTFFGGVVVLIVGETILAIWAAVSVKKVREDAEVKLLELFEGTNVEPNSKGNIFPECD